MTIMKNGVYDEMITVVPSYWYQNKLQWYFLAPSVIAANELLALSFDIMILYSWQFLCLRSLLPSSKMKFRTDVFYTLKKTNLVHT